MPARIDVYDPALCCPTGVCGPTVDPVLPRFAADLDRLRRAGVAVTRHNLSQDPAAFARDATVRTALEREGVACLPLVLVDGRVLSRGTYPDRATLERAAGLAPSAPTRTVEVELLALDLETCDRCCGTGAALDAAVEQAAQRLRADGVALTVRKTVVASLAQAQALRFASSPTVRVGGRDLPVEARETPCGTCSEDAGVAVDCRVWVEDGVERVVPTPDVLADAIVRAALAALAPSASAADRAPFVVPENLRRFLEARANRPVLASLPVASACCSSAAAPSEPPASEGACCSSAAAPSAVAPSAPRASASGCGSSTVAPSKPRVPKGGCC